MKEKPGHHENLNNIEIEARLGLNEKADVQEITNQLARSFGLESDDVAHQLSKRYYVFSQPRSNSTGKPEHPHLAVIYTPESSYVRVKMAEGKKPIMENVSRKREHFFKFDGMSINQRDKAIKEGFQLLSVKGKTKDLIYGPIFEKRKWLFNCTIQKNNFEISGDHVVVIKNQDQQKYNRFSGRTLKVIELELIGHENLGDRQLSEGLATGRKKVVGILIDNDIVPTYKAPGKSSFSEEILIEGGYLKPIKK